MEFGANPVAILALITVVVLLITNFVGLVWFAFATSSAAKLALKNALDANDHINRLATEFSNYREKIAGEYVNRDVIKEIEGRMTSAIEYLGKTSADAIDRLGLRLDRAMDRNGSGGGNKS